MTHMQPPCNLGCPTENEITSATWPHGTLCRSPDLRLRHLGHIVMRATNNKSRQDTPVYQGASLQRLSALVL